MSKSVEDVGRLFEVNLEQLAGEMRSEIEVKDRTYRFRNYPSCFVGTEACCWLVSKGYARNLTEAQSLGNLMREAGLLHHVVREHEFKNEYLFYRFAVDEDHGHVPRVAGEPPSWANLLGQYEQDSSGMSLLPEIPEHSEEILEHGLTHIPVEPLDEHNAKLLDNVYPRKWNNPEPREVYNLVVIGAGAGGLVSAAGAAGVGARVALVEEHFLGGDCLNFGCVPSKSLLAAARVAATVRDSKKYGIEIDGDVRVDFGAVMERLRRIRADISPHDSAERFASLGVDVFRGRAQFKSSDEVEVGGLT